MVWRNGYIPESDLIIFNRGWNSTDGDWYWGLTPATYARHLALVGRAKDRTGRTLEPGDGWSTVRPYGPQVIARRRYGNGAAVPGTSSHGGFWEGRETLAIDYSNWSWVYDGDRAAFYEDCRAVGLSPGMIEPDRGYPDEPWHVIDLDPKGPTPAFSDASAFEPEGFLMALSDDEQRELLNFARNFAPILEDIRDAIGAGNARNIPEQDKANRSVLQHARVAVVALGELLSRTAPVERVGANGQVEQIPLRQEIADAKTLLTKQDK